MTRKEKRKVITYNNFFREFFKNQEAFFGELYNETQLNKKSTEKGKHLKCDEREDLEAVVNQNNAAHKKIK